MDLIAGVRDFYPEDMLIRNWLIDTWKSTSVRYGFQEYDAPIIENLALYTTKGGDDIVNEMFTFKDGNVDVALRPEMTPSVVRMIMQYLKSNIAPIKWFSVPQCWRNETSTWGRKREFYQWNADIFGAEKIRADIEVLAMIVSFFKSVNITENDVVLRISNRMILQKVFEKLGVVGDNILHGFNIVDKLNKKTREELIQLFKEEINLTDDAINTIFEVTQITNINDLDKYLGKNDDTIIEMREIFSLANAYGISNWLQFDVSIVRGLSYYTGIVFEGFFKNTEMKRAVCGGGRYDNLLESYGYPVKVPAVGFGMGDVVITEVLKELKRLPISKPKSDYCIVAFKDLYSEGIKIAEQLRQKGMIVNIYMQNDKKMKTAFGYADRTGADKVIFVAPDEFSRNAVAIKDLRSENDKQKEVLIKDLVA